MYKDITFETILKKMLSAVPSDIDKREGAIIYDALAPCAIELQHMYIELDYVLKETFGDTASREYLIRRARERGMAPNEATCAILKGEFNMKIELGTRFTCDELFYVVISELEDFKYLLQCESAGTMGNRNFGPMMPVNYINGLGMAKLTELLVPGEDEEDTEVFRKRYFESFEVKAYGGNIADYLAKTNAIAGVGSTKVTPVWNGGGTVKLTILDSTFKKANNVLVELVQDTIDPTKGGDGLGIAPIGHIVTVDTAKEVMLDIEAKITFDTGYSFENLKSSIKEIIEDYLCVERRNWSEQGYLIIRIAYIESKILSLKGVLDIANTKLNGSSENLALGEFDIPILRSVVNV